MPVVVGLVAVSSPTMHLTLFVPITVVPAICSFTFALLTVQIRRPRLTIQRDFRLLLLISPILWLLPQDRELRSSRPTAIIALSRFPLSSLLHLRRFRRLWGRECLRGFPFLSVLGLLGLVRALVRIYVSLSGGVLVVGVGG